MASTSEYMDNFWNLLQIWARMSGKFLLIGSFSIRDENMTESNRKRASKFKTSGVVGVKKSGAVRVDWSKAVKSTPFKREVAGMERIKKKAQ